MLLYLGPSLSCTILLIVFICHNPSSFSLLITSSPPLPYELSSVWVCMFRSRRSKNRESERLGYFSPLSPHTVCCAVATSPYNWSFRPYWALVTAFPPPALKLNGREWLLTAVSLSTLWDFLFHSLSLTLLSRGFCWIVEPLTEPCSVVQCILNIHKGLHHFCQKVITRFVMKHKWPEKEEENGLKQQHEPKMLSFWQNLIRNKESGE